MLRFEQIDMEFEQNKGRLAIEVGALAQSKIFSFVLEGVSRLLQYLPRDQRVSTLRDLLAIYEPQNSRVTSQQESSSVIKLDESGALISGAEIDLKDDFDTMSVTTENLVSETKLILQTEKFYIQDLNGQIDYLATVNHDMFLAGSTSGQVAIFNSSNGSLLKRLGNNKLPVYECAVALKSKRMALACDGGTVLMFET